MRPICRTLAIAPFVALIIASGVARSAEPHREWFDPAGISGKLLICGGGELPARVFLRFRELAGGADARIVAIPTASHKIDEPTEKGITEFWTDHGGVASSQMLHTRSKEVANSPEFIKPLQDATGVWFGGGLQARIADAYVGTAIERELEALLDRGGVIGGTSAGAAIQSKLMIASGNPEAVLKTGFDLLPGSVIDQHFSQRERKPRLVRVLKEHAGYVGFGIDESTALLVDGRDLEVIGDNIVTICLAAGEDREALELELKEKDVADLTALRRAARDRSGPAFPPRDMKTPGVANGALIIGGGGRLPEEVMTKFIELAGGPDSLIVVFPTASADPLPKKNSSERMIREAGATNVVVLPQRKRADVESDEFLNRLKSARGVWFGGGRQWRFVDAYENTKAFELLHDVLRRGGVIGGSSAGASIQGEYLARGSPLGNREIMAEGYERGFNFLPGVAIDQHFTQRERLPDMMQLVKRFPQLIGLGVDEATAIVVQKQSALVIGVNQVHIANSTVRSGENNSAISLSNGQVFDFGGSPIPPDR
ncbi:MAG: cyanophycinase [Planctomycetes bacterium]|nr:cyanophycinase [Planctomycetota bacterium]